jgi:hypothetical protein
MQRRELEAAAVRRNPFVFSVGRLVSPRCHIIGSIAQVSSDLWYYEGSDSCRVIPQSRSPRLLRLTFLAFHPQPRDAPVPLYPPLQRVR